jgi:hypothetical protein
MVLYLMKAGRRAVLRANIRLQAQINDNSGSSRHNIVASQKQDGAIALLPRSAAANR